MEKNKEQVFEDSILDKAWLNYWMNQIEDTTVKNVKLCALCALQGKSKVYRLKLNTNGLPGFIHKLNGA